MGRKVGVSKESKKEEENKGVDKNVKSSSGSCH